MITAKIDVAKIDKSKLFKGEKTTYLDLVLIPSKNKRYGEDYMVVQGVSMEDRKAGIRGPILGNAKIRRLEDRSDPPPYRPKPQSAPPPAAGKDNLDEDVPF